jgi:outer membrane protein TolC
MRTPLIILFAASLWAQNSLTLRDAVRIGLRENQSLAAAAAGVEALEARITEARAAMLPKVNYSESFTRADNPVFVFSSLLTQHQFGAENFNIGP